MSGGASLSSAGIATLSGVNTYTGATTVTGGTTPSIQACSTLRQSRPRRSPYIKRHHWRSAPVTVGASGTSMRPAPARSITARNPSSPAASPPSAASIPSLAR